jgi:hypothetical protein
MTPAPHPYEPTNDNPEEDNDPDEMGREDAPDDSLGDGDELPAIGPDERTSNDSF